jgi:CDP-glucose 4,6-dehydratase
LEDLGRLDRLVNLQASYKGRSVFVTGHTGFKGSWLTEWLLLLGARVTGYSLPPPTEPALFTQLGLRNRIAHHEADVRNLTQLQRIMVEAKPEFVFHLAAQSLVRLSYAQPRETYDINVMGTINVLESLRALPQLCAAVFVTTDKCYAEKTPPAAYNEDDPLGGHDPYSSSKAAAELAIATYRRSFFSRPESRVGVASARAGNVVGGGDWAADRIVPDCIRSLKSGASIAVRNRSATRPWQHVLEPLSGYLELGAALAGQIRAGKALEHPAPSGDVAAESLSSAFNFGPAPGSEHSVRELVEEILKHWPGIWHDQSEPESPHEAQHLRLATNKACRLLGWSSVYDFRQTVKTTVDWYRESSSFAADDSDSFAKITCGDITEYGAARGAIFSRGY